MGKVIDFFIKPKGAVSLLAKESDVESHLKVMNDWLGHANTLLIVKLDSSLFKLYEKMLSSHNTIFSRFRTLKFAISSYEQGYESVLSSSKSRNVTFIPSPHPNARLIMQNQIHLIDAVEKNLVKDVERFLKLTIELAKKSKHEEYLLHIAVMQEAIGKFSRSFDIIEGAIDNLPAPIQQQVS